MFKNSKFVEVIVWTAVGITMIKTVGHEWPTVAIFFGVMLRQQVGEAVGRLDELEVPGLCRGKFRNRPKDEPQAGPADQTPEQGPRPAQPEGQVDAEREGERPGPSGES